MNGYQLTDAWFEFRFQHPDEVSHAHTELYFYLVYHWNKLSQKEKFGLPSAVTMEATGIRNYKTYRNALKDLARFGFIEIVQESLNQHQSMIVAWGKNTKALTETLPEALTKALTKALPYIEELKNNRTKEPIITKTDLEKSIIDFESKYGKSMIDEFFAYWTETDQKGKMRFQAEKFFDLSRRLAYWKSKQYNFPKNKKEASTDVPAENASFKPPHQKGVDFSNCIPKSRQ